MTGPTSTPVETAVVFIGGEAPHPDVLDQLPSPRWVIAADSGFDHAHRLAVTVDLLVGDLDSISERGRVLARKRDTPTECFPTDKDFTDTELALRAAVRHGAQRITVVSGVGPRLDHSLAALCVLVDPSLRGIDIDAWWGDSYVIALQGPVERTVGFPAEIGRAHV